MRSRVFIALLTIVVFGAGYGSRLWLERSRCQVPPAPALLGELNTHQPAAVNPTAKVATTPIERPPIAAKLAREIQRLRPEIEAFRTQMEQMDDQMDREVVAILRSDQMPLWQKVLNRRVEYRKKEEAGITPDHLLTAEQIASLQQQPLYKLLAVVVVPQRLEWLSNDLKLDDAQKVLARESLVRRRDKFLALVDSSPPPSLTLSRLVPLAKQLGEPKK